MAAGIRVMSATSIPVSCDGVKTHVFMDDTISDAESKFVAIDEEANHHIVHRRRRKAHRAPHEPLDPRPQMAVFPLDARCVFLPHLMRGWVDMPGVRAPSVGIKSRATKGLQQVLEFEKDGILPSPKNVRSHGATVMINRMTQPSRFRFLAYITSHLIAC